MSHVAVHEELRKRDARSGKPKLEAALFQVRFGVALSDDWALHNDPDNIATLFKLLRALPESNVDGNTHPHEIILDHTDGGLYDPTTHDVHIGENILPDRSAFEQTVRHEIGHAADDEYFSRVNPWLMSRFGWQMLGTSGDSAVDWRPLIDQWLGLMGGWGDSDRDTTNGRARIHHSSRAISSTRLMMPGRNLGSLIRVNALASASPSLDVRKSDT
jgi:hypothetical protein